ncbi:MAG: hypothetical protein RIM23_19215 [Coleofasciculus sp. G3-WIS-01]|uniref:hypothetical protein n=1 Tax=Coleofasciculus sp. G3-WIS-01 TaxID=3069528 RepID=UPI0032FFCCB0
MARLYNCRGRGLRVWWVTADCSVKGCLSQLNSRLTHDGGVAHLKWWISIVGAQVVRPISPSNLFHNFSCVSPLLAWHT